MIITSYVIQCDKCYHSELCETAQAALRSGWMEQERINIEKFSRQKYIVHLCPKCAQGAPEKVVVRL